MLTLCAYSFQSPATRIAPAGRHASIAMATPNAAPIYDGEYAAELRETASAMVAPGKGLLACDESTGTVGTRLESIGLENNEANRQKWRNLLFTTKGIGQYISGAILFEETLFQDDPAGKPFVDVLKGNGIIPGIKVDTGLIPLCGGGDGEKWCRGLDNLAERCAGYYKQGARFAKWRTALTINVAAGCPTDLAIDVAAQDLARYARICQENGLVPIVEPEILLDGDHDIATTARVQERVLSTVYMKLQDNGVLLEGSLLKPSMTVPGIDCADKSDPATIAKMTVRTLDRSLPSAMPGVTFLSGGISEEDSSIYLNEINKLERKGAFALTFSYSRALQSSCIKIWGGKEENYQKAQDQLLARAQANAEASAGKYVPGSQPSIEESLFVKNYVY
uniref:Fructose-bisphosphate aldolase n=2 Tax=Emiliania huxleyi TaxID=2903 RepID=J3S3U2_EMIHU|nr:fructose-1,6-bisphosphate aldolase class I [Emiliania huxleyi]